MEIQFLNGHDKLIEKLAKGDRKAQMELYKMYYKAMFNTSLRILNNSFEAEDIMQEAFLTAFTRINEYQGKVSFGAWLKKIVINKSLDELKKKKPFFEDVEKIPQFSTEEPENLEENVSYKIEMIKAAIKNLADGYRIILSLYLLEGYDHEEIGEILSISPSTSRSQFTRAKRKLKEELSLMPIFNN
ncbi:MAG: sigma-70 family RNA polymerase sigma factor [Bacteroidales bacterium]|nr:sigma-70 family RNA polymerase sigma factor [Bacteroidales bacterium]